MKVIGRIKYKLWRWLMDDLCDHSGTSGTCDGCECRHMREGNKIWDPCAHNQVYCQAYRVWMIDNA